MPPQNLPLLVQPIDTVVQRNERDEKCYDGSYSNLSSTTTITNPTESLSNEYYAVKWFSEWEGYGCVALQDIGKHTIIHEEEPMLKAEQITNALERHVNGVHMTPEDDKNYLENECGLKKEDIDKLWQLHDQHQDRYANGKNEKRLWGILMSNTFENEENNYQRRLYVQTSRFNHSCSPNIGYDFNNWTIRLFTTRDVKAGDTLCIAYSDVIYFFPQEKRQKYLLSAMKFKCACSACSPSPHDLDENQRILEKSDENRKRLKQIGMELRDRVESDLYDATFCIHVNDTIKRMSSTSKEEEKTKEITETEKIARREQLMERVRLRKLSKNIPIGEYDLNLIMEYIQILQDEKIDHDMIPIFELGYKVASQIGSPSTSEWSSKCLELFQFSKGIDHPKTRAFQDRIAMGKMSK